MYAVCFSIQSTRHFHLPILTIFYVPLHCVICNELSILKQNISPSAFCISQISSWYEKRVCKMSSLSCYTAVKLFINTSKDGL